MYVAIELSEQYVHYYQLPSKTLSSKTFKVGGHRVAINKALIVPPSLQEALVYIGTLSGTETSNESKLAFLSLFVF